MSRRANNNVTLFPFLAVLVCAMGALILLLLVTTRRIRSDQLAGIESQQVEEPVEPNTITTGLELPVPDSPTTMPIPTEQPKPSAPLAAVAEAKVETPLADGVAEVDRREDHQQRDLEVLRGYDKRLTEQLSRWAEHDQQLQAHFTALSKQHNQLNTQEEQLRQQASISTEDSEHLAETEQRLAIELASAKRELDEKEAQPVIAESKFRIVPFDGLSGTVRRPIMIECVNDRYRFLPEGVQISKSELETFVASFNPLLSGASALSNYWSHRDKHEYSSAATNPYILLIVRPSGAIGFYGAKRMLAKLGVPVGYELLGEDQELDLPAADPQATRVCREAIKTTLARADEINTLRPYAQQLLAAVREGGMAPTPPAGTRRYDLPTGDKRVESFQRALVGIRTRNAPRPPSLNEYPDFRSRRDTSPEMVTQSYAANAPTPRGSRPGGTQAPRNNPGAQTSLSSARPPGSHPQQTGATTSVSPSDVFGPRDHDAIGRATLAQRSASPQSGPYENGQPTSAELNAPTLPGTPDNTGQATNGRPGSITDGSTKPVESTATASTNGSALPGELDNVSASGLANFDRAPAITLYPVSYTHLTLPTILLV